MSRCFRLVLQLLAVTQIDGCDTVKMNDVEDFLSVTTHYTYFLNFGGFSLFSVFELDSLDTATLLMKISPTNCGRHDEF